VDSNLGNKKIAVAQNYLTNVLNAMGLENITQTVIKSETSAVIRLDGDGLGAIIGRRGETLDAIQYLVSLVCCRKENEDYRIYIDCGNFREKREETLRELAAKVAKQVQKNGRNTTLEPMNPYERRIIHSVISEIPGLFSRSIGEEPHRKVVVMLEKNKNYNPKPRNRK
ncbi:MAG: KH domain-containing protein, partial [Oscillospiraceae bacterium]|nr:KH domain-containing protein [Oscillospiraceae bacterium]